MMDKIRTYLYLCFIPATLFFSGGLAAAPQNGMGIYLGVIGASEDSVTSNGLSLGVDALFVIAPNWSLSPYLMISAERDTYSRTITDGLAGIALRRWQGDWFIGVHAFEHDRLIIDNGTVQNSAYGLSGGLTAGFEKPNGWGAQAQADLFESTYIRGTQRNALRVHLTYRWH